VCFYTYFIYINKQTFGKTLKLSGIERASIIYQQVNLIIPLIVAVWERMGILQHRLYDCSKYYDLDTRQVVICGDKKLEFKKIIANINISAIFLGLILF
jgi:hypothetical protein